MSKKKFRRTPERCLEHEWALLALMSGDELDHEAEGFVQYAADNDMMTPEEAAKWDEYCEAHPWQEEYPQDEIDEEEAHEAQKVLDGEGDDDD